MSKGCTHPSRLTLVNRTPGGDDLLWQPAVARSAAREAMRESMSSSHLSNMDNQSGVSRSQDVTHRGL